MKLCIISHYPPMSGGISKYTRRNVEILRKMGVTTYILPVDTLINSCVILPFVIKHKPDIIRLEYAISMYHTASLFILMQLFIAKFMLGIKLVVNYHEVKRDTQILGFIGKTYYGIFSKLFDLIFVHTLEAKNILIDVCKVNTKKVIVMPHGLFLPNMTKVKNENKTKKKTVLFFGFIHVHKGIEYLIEAWSELLKKNPEIGKNSELVIAGSVRERKGVFKLLQKTDVDYYKMLVEKVKQLQIGKTTKFLGYVADDKINQLLSNATIIVIPYTSTEQSGVLNQVLPFKVPIIATNIGGIGETLKNNGVLVKPKDAAGIALQMKKLLTNSLYYKAIKSKYQKLNESLEPQKIITQQSKYYKLLLNKKYE